MARVESDTPKPKAPRRPTGARKKLSAFNKFMQTEMARLKEDEPDMPHQERFKLATKNWKDAKENPKNAASSS
ncbi:YABBY family protein [Pleurotus pulmonarius]